MGSLKTKKSVHMNLQTFENKFTSSKIIQRANDGSVFSKIFVKKKIFSRKYFQEKIETGVCAWVGFSEIDSLATLKT